MEIFIDEYYATVSIPKEEFYPLFLAVEGYESINHIDLESSHWPEAPESDDWTVIELVFSSTGAMIDWLAITAPVTTIKSVNLMSESEWIRLGWENGKARTESLGLF